MVRVGENWKDVFDKRDVQIQRGLLIACHSLSHKNKYPLIHSLTSPSKVAVLNAMTSIHKKPSAKS